MTLRRTLPAVALLLAAGPAWAASPIASYGKLPVIFEENRGQAPGQVRFLSVQGASGVFLMDRQILISSAGYAVAMRFHGGAAQPRLEGLDRLPGRSHYYQGKAPWDGYTNIPHHARVRYRGVYPEVDLEVYGRDGQLEYDWIVSPGADPGTIRFTFDGADEVRLDKQGALVLQAGSAEIRHHQPVAYQEVDGTRREVVARFRLRGNEVAFEVGAYDRALPLVIDPILEYTARPAGVGGYEGRGIAIDAAGNAYFTGAACTVRQRPGGTPYPDCDYRHIFVGKLDATGSTLLYGVRFTGDMYNWGEGIAVDAQGKAYVVDRYATVLRFSPTGQLAGVYSAVEQRQPTEGSGITIDSRGLVYIVGRTASPNFPATPGALQTKQQGPYWDGFVAKLDPASERLVYATYLGGSRVDEARAIAVDRDGNAYVTGFTYSDDFPVTAGAFQTKFAGPVEGTAVNRDAFVAKLNATGTALIYGTYLGGGSRAGHDEAAGIAVDSTGNAHVIGWTWATDFPTKNAFQPHRPPYNTSAFVAKLNPTGSDLVYSTYLGGNGNDQGLGIAVDAAGRAYVTGSTGSTGFPVRNAFQSASVDERRPCQVIPFLRMCLAPFVASFDPSGRLLYSTYLGGAGTDNAGRAVAVDIAGNAYVAGIARPPQVGAYSKNEGMLFVAKIAPDGVPPFVPYRAIVNAASFSHDLPLGGLMIDFSYALAPGTLATIFGTGLTRVNGIRVADTIPLPTELEGTSVWYAGVPAPILAVANVDGQEQINIQVPFESEVLGFAEVRRDGITGFFLPSVRYPSPGIFTVGGLGAIQHAADYSLVSAANPATPGEIVVIYATGLGEVDPAVPSGVPAPTAPLSRTVETPEVRIGDQKAEVLFAGLTPGGIGLYQVNARVPENVPSGSTRIQLIYPYYKSNIVLMPVR